MKKVLKFLKHNGLFVFAGAVLVASIASIPFIYMSSLGATAATFVSIGTFLAGVSVSLLIGTTQHILNVIGEMRREKSQGKCVPLTEENLTLEDKEQLAALRKMQEKKEIKKEKNRHKEVSVDIENNNDFSL